MSSFSIVRFVAFDARAKMFEKIVKGKKFHSRAKMSDQPLSAGDVAVATASTSTTRRARVVPLASMSRVSPGATLKNGKKKF